MAQNGQRAVGASSRSFKTTCNYDCTERYHWEGLCKVVGSLFGAHQLAFSWRCGNLNMGAIKNDTLNRARSYV